MIDIEKRVLCKTTVGNLLWEFYCGFFVKGDVVTESRVWGVLTYDT